MTKRYGMVFDQNRCVGCKACSVGCAEANRVTAGFRIRVERMSRHRQGASEKCAPDPRMIFLPQTCMHCGRPPCIESCPVGALVKRDDGPVVLNQDICNGCRECMAACPYGAFIFDEATGKADKCDMCVQRIDRGLEPVCVACCIGSAIYFGDLNHPSSEIYRIVTKENTFQFKAVEKTDPSIFYLPPHNR